MTPPLTRRIAAAGRLCIIYRWWLTGARLTQPAANVDFGGVVFVTLALGGGLAFGL